MTRRLVGVREIAKLLGTSRQRADQLVRTKGFPEPVAELASGRVWARSDVVRWAKIADRSIPWATVELELEQMPQGPPGSAANHYRMAWTTARLKQLGRDPMGAPTTREGIHALALAAAREVDAGFDVHVPEEVDDEADEVPSAIRRSQFRGAELWFARCGDDRRGYWHVEWNGSEWWLRQCFVADGSGWNMMSRRPLGRCNAGPELAPFLRRELLGREVPIDVVEEFVPLVLRHVCDGDPAAPR